MHFSKKPGVYKITNILNNKIYIGKANDLNQRIPVHWYPSYKDSYFDRSCKKYGKENFIIEILHEQESLNVEELLALEVAFIDFFDCLFSNGGYNMCLFSNDNTGLKRTKETKEKLSIGKLGEKNPRFGLEHSKRWRSDVSNKMIGSQNHSFGKQKSEETILKIKQKRKLQDLTFAHKKIVQKDLDGNVLKIWKSATFASKEIWGNKKKTKLIHQACQKKINLVLNFTWEYL